LFVCLFVCGWRRLSFLSSDSIPQWIPAAYSVILRRASPGPAINRPIRAVFLRRVCGFLQQPTHPRERVISGTVTSGGATRSPVCSLFGDVRMQSIHFRGITVRCMCGHGLPIHLFQNACFTRL